MDPSSQHFILHWLVAGLSVLLTSKLIRNFEISGYFAALMAALVIGFANAILWPVFFWLTLPVTVVTLGLFVFVINGAVLKICAALLPGFEIRTWGAAIGGSIVLSVISYLLHLLLI